MSDATAEAPAPAPPEGGPTEAIPADEPASTPEESLPEQPQPEEPPTIKTYKYVAIGGGNAAGYWAYTLIKELQKAGVEERSIAIITTYPEGLVPYERPAMTKAAINPAMKNLRNFTNPAFPFTMKGSMLEALGMAWYAENGITLYWQSDCLGVDFEKKLITVEQAREGGRIIQVGYEQLLLSTGSTSRTLEGGATEPLWSRRHPDISTAPTDGNLNLCKPEWYGFGSVHYPRDLGCIAALTFAMTKKEAVGQVPCEDPVVLVGGGYLNLEAAAGVVTFAPQLKVVVCLPGEHMLESLFPPKLADFYERQLAARGVMFARNVSFKGWWPKEEHGEFSTLGGDDPFNLRPVEPRPFRKCSKFYSFVRGVVLTDNATGAEVRMPARFVICGVGSVPNSSPFTSSGLQATARGHLIVDAHLRPAGLDHVYAAGDLCAFPLALDDHKLTKLEHVQHARDSAAHVARCMVQGAGAVPAYAPVPYFYSRYLDFAWKFYGVVRGEPVVIGLESFESTKELLVVWVLDGRLVGVLLEGGTADMQAALPVLARTRPPIHSTRALSRLSVRDFFKDPSALAPPVLPFGDFRAETDPDAVASVLHHHDRLHSGSLATSELPDVMAKLGASWSDLELKEIRQVLDPEHKGRVPHEAFLRWWRSEPLGATTTGSSSSSKKQLHARPPTVA